jgi:hypothetical protein
MAQEKIQMNVGRGLNERGSEEANCPETVGAVSKEGIAPFVTEIGGGCGSLCIFSRNALYCIGDSAATAHKLWNHQMTAEHLVVRNNKLKNNSVNIIVKYDFGYEKE